VPDARSQVAAGLGAAVVTTVVISVLVLVGSGPLLRFDVALTSFTGGWVDAPSWSRDLAAVVGRATQPVVLFAVALVVVLLLLRAGHRAPAAVIAASGLIGVSATTVLKQAVQRERPVGAAEYVRAMDVSFPSGHASVGIYLVLATGFVLLRLGAGCRDRRLSVAGRVLIVVGPLVGVSRLVLGVHWPTDVVAGWAVGSAAFCGAALLLWAPLVAGAGAEPAAEDAEA
jgi:undecaprenyl-diphosphatase